MTHQDGPQDEASQNAHEKFIHNLDHAEAEVDQLGAHAVKAHPVPHEGHHF